MAVCIQLIRWNILKLWKWILFSHCYCRKIRLQFILSENNIYILNKCYGTLSQFLHEHFHIFLGFFFLIVKPKFRSTYDLNCIYKYKLMIYRGTNTAINIEQIDAKRIIITMNSFICSIWLHTEKSLFRFQYINLKYENFRLIRLPVYKNTILWTHLESLL